MSSSGTSFITEAGHFRGQAAPPRERGVLLRVVAVSVADLCHADFDVIENLAKGRARNTSARHEGRGSAAEIVAAKILHRELCGCLVLLAFPTRTREHELLAGALLFSAFRVSSAIGDKGTLCENLFLLCVLGMVHQRRQVTARFGWHRCHTTDFRKRLAVSLSRSCRIVGPPPTS